MASCLEMVGFDACAVTDHPFPSDRFLANAGHHALDPLVARTWAAPATQALRLHTNVYVLPYRNPFLTAKGAATLDVLSGRQLILGLGAGYLRSEFLALGADFDQRNARLAEGLALLRRAWTESGVAVTAPGLEVGGNTMRPVPAQRPHPPLWIGGNSRAAIRNAVDHGQGWGPFETGPVMASSARTAALHTVDQLVGRLAYLRRYAKQHGRSAPLEVCLTLAALPEEGTLADRFDDRRKETSGLWAVDGLLDRLAAEGVDWVVVQFPRCRSVEHYSELAEHFAQTFIEGHR